MMCFRSALRATVRRSAFNAPRFLSSKCAEELADERAELENLETPVVPEGWKLHAKAGQGYFRVARENGPMDTQLLVDCELEAQDGDTTGFTVVAKRKGKVVDFTLRYQESGTLTVVGMASYPDWNTATDLTPEAELKRDNTYDGPSADELETAGLAQEAQDYLVQLGIDADFGRFVHVQCAHLEQSEYIRLLEDVKAFAA